MFDEREILCWEILRHNPYKNNDLFWKVTKNVVHNTNNGTGQMKKVISYPNNITILLLKKSPKIEQWNI